VNGAIASSSFPAISHFGAIYHSASDRIFALVPIGGYSDSRAKLVMWSWYASCFGRVVLFPLCVTLSHIVHFFSSYCLTPFRVNNAWTNVSVANSATFPYRQSPCAWTQGNFMYLFGGADPKTNEVSAFTGVWRIDITVASGASWTQQATTGTPCSSDAARALYQ
jgi:hypothetical protein